MAEGKKTGSAKKHDGLTKRQQRLFERWESEIEDIRGLLTQAAGIRNPSPQEQPDAIVKTEVYRLVTELLHSDRPIDLEIALAHKMEASPRVKFKANPYYWGLKAVSKDKEAALNGNVVSKFAAELLYASRHGIPPELLTGFISQVGGIRGIRLRLGRNEMESWYRPALSWL